MPIQSSPITPMPASLQWMRPVIILRAIALALMLGLSVGGNAATKAPGEYEVKAAFLYNFIAFTEWPEATFENTTSPIVIGVLGKDPFGSALDKIMNGERVKDRSLIVWHITRLEDANRCQILFISASESGQTNDIIRQLRTQPVLTVSDIPGFAEAGGMVGFTTADTVKLVINQEALRTAHLSLSAKILRLARLVERTPSP